MQVRGKLFTYPVLNKNNELSSYNDRTFNIDLEVVDKGDEVILNNVRYITNCITLHNLIKENEAIVYLIIEQSGSNLRTRYNLSQEPQTIHIDKKQVDGAIEISLFAVANKDIILNSSEVDVDYQGIEFYIEKNDILAINDGYTLNVTHSEKEDNFVESIFRIINLHEQIENDLYTVDYKSNKIEISLGENTYKSYKKVYSNLVLKEIFFSMILIPVLVEGINLCMKKYEENNCVDDVCDEYKWFRSIINAYKRISEEGLLENEATVDSFEVAQKLLCKPFGSALETLVSICKGRDEEEQL